MPTDSRPRVGVLGGGFMAAVHSRAARAAGARLVALASSSPEKSTAAARALGFERAAADVDSLIADREVDVVHICTPNESHEALTAAAVSAGKHVICEKPLATTHQAALRLTDLAAAAGAVATVPFVYRFHPMVREARARIRAGQFGVVTSIQATYLQDWLLDAQDDNWRVDGTVGGRSRAFADIGSHLVDMIEFVTGLRIAGLCAVTRTVHPVRAGRTVLTEDLAAVLIRLTGGAVGTILVSQVAAGHANDLRFEIFGTEASIRFAQESPDTLEIGQRGRRTTIERDAATLAPAAARLSLIPAGHPMGYQDAFTAFVRDSYAAVRGDVSEGLPQFHDGARASLLTDAVVSSAASGEWVRINNGDRTPRVVQPQHAHM